MKTTRFRIRDYLPWFLVLRVLLSSSFGSFLLTRRRRGSRDLCLLLSHAFCFLRLPHGLLFLLCCSLLFFPLFVLRPLLFFLLSPLLLTLGLFLGCLGRVIFGLLSLVTLLSLLSLLGLLGLFGLFGLLLLLFLLLFLWLVCPTIFGLWLLRLFGFLLGLLRLFLLFFFLRHGSFPRQNLPNGFRRLVSHCSANDMQTLKKGVGLLRFKSSNNFVGRHINWGA
mmetsp:Transcript_47156/g.102640  ORF Transcript_47156/g.102640 Transcript_47156/m.102640 type:complete len:223 (+) Transcript_47156:972-1640(+)